ncbi:MAG: hypothetical protein EXQ51_09035 [Acidobacteria bacterium]|nr:hypothetical protein [Acidobacteriota bacterium]
MSPTLSTRIVAMMAALAVVLAGLLPVAHLHADDDHPVVHRHALADGSDHPDDHADDHGAGLDQPDHTAARILTPSYDLTRHVLEYRPVGVAPSCVETEIAPMAPSQRTTLLPTHDPPLRFFSSPAPPAFV